MYTCICAHKFFKHFSAAPTFIRKKTHTNFAIVFTIAVVTTAVFVQSYAAALFTPELSIRNSGTISYITARKLHADGAWLKDSYGNIVQLVGYAGGVQTLSPSPVGLWERNGDTQHYVWDFDEQAIMDNLDAMKDSGANCLRSHLAMWWIKNDGKTMQELGLAPWQDTGEPITYKQNIHRIIELAGERGIYVILDGMTITPDFLDGGGQDALPYPPYQDDEPDQMLAQSVIANPQDFIDLWLELALYLKDLPNVIFEPWNEPHAPSGYDEATLRNEWFTVYRDLVATFRANGIDHPIILHWGYGSFVNWSSPNSPDGKMNWANQANTTTNDPIQNLIFSTHLYRTGGAFGVQSLGQARQEYDDVKQAMQLELIEYTAVNLSLPVLIGEIGASLTQDPANESLALENALQVLNEWQIGWLIYWWRTETQWSIFNSNTYILQPDPNFNTNGLIVRDAMLEKS